MPEYNEEYLKVKERAVERARQPGPAPAPDREDGPRQDRLPPGQHRTAKFPVLDLGIQPDWDPATWQLQIIGLVAHPVELSWDEFRLLPHVDLVADFHCVTRWSKFDVHWRGVRFSTILELVRPTPDAAHVIQRSADGYSTNLPLSVLLDEDVLLADELDGSALSREHGAPLRTIVPGRYAWKGAKFLRQLEFTKEDQPGFWETRGYHNQGDPWKEERFAQQWWV